tara:strand:- start:8 stop:325 length:318 start_codon:yes stop_codon:yes gene_type:complete
MSKASDRLQEEWVDTVNDMWAIEFTLAQIRARRDEIKAGDGVQSFWSLFDDGAEFGPDKPEPEIMFVPNLAGYIDVVFNPSGSRSTISTDIFNAIKKLGAEEAKS